MNRHLTGQRPIMKFAGRNSGAVALVIALVAPFVAAAVGGAATSSSVSTWYKTLKKPSWNPPPWIFGPVWTLLYALMGVASWLVWKEGRSGNEDGFSTSAESQAALKLYGVHLVFNALWSILFFGLRRIGWATAEIAVLWSLIAATLTRFYRINPLAGMLLVPYLLWGSFASVLNIKLWQLNRK
jgi:translocator protein